MTFIIFRMTFCGRRDEGSMSVFTSRHVRIDEHA